MYKRQSLKRAVKDLALYYRIELDSAGNVWLFPLIERVIKETTLQELSDMIEAANPNKGE